MRGLTIAAVLLAAVALLAGSSDAQRRGSDDERASFWPKLKPKEHSTGFEVVVDEWYSDLPWQQKLGTFNGNEINEAIVLPYAALQAKDRTYCKNHNITDPG